MNTIMDFYSQTHIRNVSICFLMLAFLDGHAWLYLRWAPTTPEGLQDVIALCISMYIVIVSSSTGPVTGKLSQVYIFCFLVVFIV